jgi:hypothetical protein
MPFNTDKVRALCRLEGFVMRGIAVAAALACSTACTSVNTARVPSGREDIFVSTADVPCDASQCVGYRSLGLVQVTRRGVALFGFIDPAGTDLEDAVNDLVPEVRKLGGDGVINVRFEQAQYSTAARVLGVLFFFAPFPTEVTLTGEVVKLDPVGGSR